MTFAIKLIANGIVAIPLLMWFSEASFFGAAIAVVILGLVSFWLGDLLVLKYSNNMAATALDVVLAFFYFWFASSYANWSLAFNELIIIAIAVGIVEAVFHFYLQNTKEAAT